MLNSKQVRDLQVKDVVVVNGAAYQVIYTGKPLIRPFSRVVTLMLLRSRRTDMPSVIERTLHARACLPVWPGTAEEFKRMWEERSRV